MTLKLQSVEYLKLIARELNISFLAKINKKELLALLEGKKIENNILENLHRNLIEMDNKKFTKKITVYSSQELRYLLNTFYKCNFPSKATKKVLLPEMIKKYGKNLDILESDMALLNEEYKLSTSWGGLLDTIENFTDNSSGIPEKILKLKSKLIKLQQCKNAKNLKKTLNNLDLDEITINYLNSPLLDELLESKPKSNNSWILSAAKNKKFLAVKFLVETGADFTVYDNSVLNYMTLYNNIELVKLLVKRGADVHGCEDGPLRIAARGGNLELVEFFIKNGADIHAVNEYALRWACKKGHFEIVKFLIATGADYSVLDDEPVKQAANSQKWEIVDFLVEKFYKNNEEFIHNIYKGKRLIILENEILNALSLDGLIDKNMDDDTLEEFKKRAEEKLGEFIPRITLLKSDLSQEFFDNISEVDCGYKYKLLETENEIYLIRILENEDISREKDGNYYMELSSMAKICSQNNLVDVTKTLLGISSMITKDILTYNEEIQELVEKCKQRKASRKEKIVKT